MTTMDAQTLETWRRIFKRFNPFMVMLWRLGFRRWINFWPRVGGRILVLTHIGRKSGLRRRTPLNYYPADGELYCTAGYGPASDWYRNILAHPDVEVWLPDGWWAGQAEQANDSPRRIDLLRQVIIASGVVGPLFGVDPGKLNDEQLDRATAGYCLVRIRLTRPLSGRGGPGDLAWVWLPIGTLLLLAYFLWRAA
jgi:deazaflavin-dependent oxidoreductase (nitroreductase family)